MYGLVRRLAVVGVMVAVLGILAWAGFYNLRSRRAAIKAAQANEVVLTKADPGASMDPAVVDSVKGKPAPEFKLVDTTGKKVTLSQFKGHPVVVNFWATWCGPCKLEMPWLEELSNKYKGQGLVVLGLSQDDSTMTKDELAKAAKKAGVTYTILMPDDVTAKAYSLSDYLPETFYVDSSGKIVDHTLGAHPKEEIEADVEKTMAASK
jgi:peroxiredoxin